MHHKVNYTKMMEGVHCNTDAREPQITLMPCNSGKKMSEDEPKSKEAEHLFAMVKDFYGHHLRPEELEEVKKGVERMVEAAEAVRKVKLGNWDEPFFVFRPYRKEE